MKPTKFLCLLVLVLFVLRQGNAQNLKILLYEEGMISTTGNEFNPSITADGKTLSIVRSLPGFKESKIMVSRVVKGK